MFKQAMKPWRFALVISLVVLLAFGTSLSLFGASVDPDYWEGNDPSIADFILEYDPDCDEVMKAKYNSGNPGGLDDGTLYVYEEIDGKDVIVFQVDIEFGTPKGGDEYESISFSNASKPVLGVFIKAGPGGNMYVYDPGVYEDDDLFAPGTLGISHVSFYYCNDEIEEESFGTLTVHKDVFGDTSGLSELPDFVITVTGPEGFSDTQTIAGGASFSWYDLVPGIYTVTEDTTGFSAEWAVSFNVESGAVADGDENQVEVFEDLESVVRVENTYTEEEDPVGSLTVYKDVFGDTSGLSELPDFVITVEGPGDFSDTQTIADGGHYTWTNLVPGIYTVTEDTTGFSSEWSVDIDVETGAVVDGEENEVEVFADTESVVYVENTYTEEEDPVGSLKVTKQVIDAPDDMTMPLFEIIVTGPEGFSDSKILADGESYTWENLVPGTYFVSEEISEMGEEWIVEIEVVVGGVDEGEEGEVAVIADGLSEVVVKNTYDEIEEEAFGSLTVYKEVLGDVSGLSELPDFEITVTGPEGFSDTQIIAGGSSYTWLDLVPGIYTVTEDTSEFSDEWSVEIVVEFGEFIGSDEGEVEVYEDLESEVIVKNTYDEIEEEAFGSLTVHKVVTGDTDELDELPEFRFTVTGPNGFSDTKVIAGGESYTWFELEAGTYTVTEDKSELGEGWSVSGEGSVEVVDDLESEITVTNSYNDLPDTGGDPLTMALAGMMLAGAGTVIRRKRR